MQENNFYNIVTPSIGRNVYVGHQLKVKENICKTVLKNEDLPYLKLFHCLLQEFYKKVSTPLLKDIIIQYPTAGISDVTKSRFHHYFGGDEIVVAGKVDTDQTSKVESFIEATSAVGFKCKSIYCLPLMQAILFAYCLFFTQFLYKDHWKEIM